MDILPNDLYFREFLQGPIEIFKVRADAKDIEFVVDLAADLPLMVRLMKTASASVD